jgi:ATP-dependent DNA helicase RecG
MLKMFSLIDFGERAGSGLSGICKVWEKVYHTPVILEETHNNGVDRTMLTLSTGGNEQDVDTMLALYGVLNAESDQEKRPGNIEFDQKTSKATRKSDQTDQKKRIIEMLKSNPNIARSEIAQVLGIHDSSVKRRLDSLVSEGKIRRVGPDKGGYWEVLKP